MKRIDVPAGLLDGLSAGDDLRLPDDTAHYVENVLRKNPGDRVEFFDGRGQLAVVEVIARDGFVEIIERTETDENESPLTTTLYQAIPKGKRWKWLLQKATELGVSRVVPLETRHTVVQIPEDRLKRKLDRWHKIASSAARQSQRARVPEVTRPRNVEEALSEAGADLQLVAHPSGDAPSISEAIADTDAGGVDLWIGPEGGFDDREIETLVAAGVDPVTMGPRILRSETGGIAAMAVVQSMLGDI